MSAAPAEVQDVEDVMTLCLATWPSVRKGRNSPLIHPASIGRAMLAHEARGKPPYRFEGLPPALAGDLAYQLFCTPKLSSHRGPDHDMLVERARFHLRNAEWMDLDTPSGRIQAYIYNPAQDTAPKASVLIAHGWTAESSFMAVFAEQLRRNGFRVVMFDQPAHGKSEGDRASLIDCARAVLHVAKTLGPFRFVVGHSMGCLASLLAGEGHAPLAEAYPFERYVLVSSPNAITRITRNFADSMGLGVKAQVAFERRLERVAHRKIAEVSALNLLRSTGRDALVIHARDDHEVLFDNALEITSEYPNAKLLAVDGAGHRKILFASNVVRAAIGFFSEGI